MSTDVPVHHYKCAVYFFFFGITYTMTFQLVDWGTYIQIHQKLNLPVYLHASLPSEENDLPVTTTCVPVHSYTRSFSFRLTVKIYPSTVLLFYMSRDTCSSIYQFGLFFCTSYAMTFQLTYWGTYPQILFTLMLLFRLSINYHHHYFCTCPYLYPFMAVPVHFHSD